MSKNNIMSKKFFMLTHFLLEHFYGCFYIFKDHLSKWICVLVYVFRNIFSGSISLVFHIKVCKMIKNFSVILFKLTFVIKTNSNLKILANSTPWSFTKKLLAKKCFQGWNDTKRKSSQPSCEQKRAEANYFRHNADDGCLIS